MTYRYFHFLLVLCMSTMVHAMDSDKSPMAAERTLERMPRTPLFAVGAVCSNPAIVGVKTTDKVQVMLLRRFVEESSVLSKAIRQVEGRGLLASVAMTQAELNKMIPYLKLGAEITRLEKEKQSLNPLLGNEYDPLIDDAREQLKATIAGYDLTAWNACRKAARKLGLTRVNEVALAVGKEKGWLKVPKKIESEDN